MLNITDKVTKNYTDYFSWIYTQQYDSIERMHGNDQPTNFDMGSSM